MAASDPANRTGPRASYAFGDFVLDGERCELRRHRRVVQIEPKVLDFLALLARHRSRVVSREELFAALWPAQHVSDEALTYCVKTARRAVGDSGEAQHTIATVRGHGYRFVAEVWELASATAAAPSVVAPLTALDVKHVESFFVGREPVMARLAGALAAAASGQGRVVLLSGEPGIGKTRTADELARLATRHDAEVLVGRCYEGGGAPPFWPWVQILRAFVGARDRAQTMALMGNAVTELAALMPELAGGASAAGTGSLASEDARFGLFDGMTAFLARASRTRPLVVVLDDLHWADRASLLLLQFLGRELHATRILVVATFRDTEVGDAHPLLVCTAELARTAGCTRIPLAGLTSADVGSFIEATTGRAPAPATTAALYEQTGGNPFFVTEMVRVLLAAHGAGDAGALHGRIPGSLREVVLRRLETLSPAARDVLRVASVFGREADAALLARVPRDGRRRGRAALLSGLEEGVRARLVEPVAGDAGAYRFVHALVREAIYDALPIAERARLHDRIGTVLAAAHASDLGQQLAVLAHHFEVAALAGGAERAVEYARRAGDRAAATYAWEEAVAHYERALGLLERPGAVVKRRAKVVAGARRDEDLVDALLFGLGENLWRSGELERARAMFRRAAERARASSAAESLARAALGFGGGFRGFEVGVVEPELIALLEEALGLLPRRASGLRARVLARLAVALYHVPGSAARRQELSREAVRVAAQTRDASAQLAALYSRHWAIWSADTLRDRLGAASAMRRLAERVHDRETTLHARRFHLIDSLEIGDLAAVDADLEACDQLARELRQPYYLWYAAQLRAMRALLAGRVDESEQLVAEALQAGRRAQSRNVEQVHGSQMLWIRREQGRLGEVAPALQTLVGRYPLIAGWRAALALVLAELGRPAEARVHFDVVAANDFAAVARDAFWLGTMTILADACAEIGDRERAAVLLRILDRYRGRVVEITVGSTCLGPIERALGRLAGVLQRWDVAVEDFARAREVADGLQAPLLLARVRRDLAGALLRRGRASDARTALRELAEAESLQAAAGVPPGRIAALREQAQKLVTGRRASRTSVRVARPGANAREV